MTLPSLTIPDQTYELAWKNRKADESIPELIAWCIHFAFDPELKPVFRGRIPSKPLLSYVEVLP